jgi:hypothetical protein
MSQGMTLVVPIRPAKWTGLQPLKDVFLNTSHQNFFVCATCLKPDHRILTLVQLGYYARNARSTFAVVTTCPTCLCV